MRSGERAGKDNEERTMRSGGRTEKDGRGCSRTYSGGTVSPAEVGWFARRGA
jgi:hypothetical protein